MRMNRNISQGAGKFTPKVWRELNDLIRFVENDGHGLSTLLRTKQNKFGQSIKIILAQITGYEQDPRNEYGHLEDDPAGAPDCWPSGQTGKYIVNRWVYNWVRYVPETTNSNRFVAAGDGAGDDPRFKMWGNTSGANAGMGPAYNLMEQNNRPCGDLQGLNHPDCRSPASGTGTFHERGAIPKSAPGWPPIQDHESHDQNDDENQGNDASFLIPIDWNVQPIGGNPIVVMYLVRAADSISFDSYAGGSTPEIDKHGVVPCFFLTNAIGPCYFSNSSGAWGARGNTCYSD